MIFEAVKVFGFKHSFDFFVFLNGDMTVEQISIKVGDESYDSRVALFARSPNSVA